MTFPFTGDIEIPRAPEAPHPALTEFLEPYTRPLPRSETRQTMERYITGLLSDLPRRNGQTIGEALEGTAYRRIFRLLTDSPWNEKQLERERVQTLALHGAYGRNAVRYDGVPQGRLLIIDDTGFPKKGTHSVGVARQYSGTLGKIGNCQVVVAAHYADDRYQWPITQRLYLPEQWARAPERRLKARIPAAIEFQTKPQIALDLLDQAQEWGVHFEIVVADSGYGQNGPFLDGLVERNHYYITQVDVTFQVRKDNRVQTPAYSGRGRPPKSQPSSPHLKAQALFDALEDSAWNMITWGEGTRGAQTRRIAATRAYRAQRGAVYEAGWLIAERSLPGHDQEEKYFFSNLPENVPVDQIVRWGHRRWVIERFYQDAKECCALDEYQGRSWVGLHRHMALVNLAYTWLLEQQEYIIQVTESHQRADSTTSDRPASYPGPSVRAVWRDWIRHMLVWLLIWAMQTGLLRPFAGPI